MEIKEFFLVLKPRVNHVLADCIHRTSVADIALSYRGGLSPAEIVAVFSDEAEAVVLAKRLIAERDRTATFLLHDVEVGSVKMRIGGSEKWIPARAVALFLEGFEMIDGSPLLCHADLGFLADAYVLIKKANSKI